MWLLYVCIVRLMLELSHQTIVHYGFIEKLGDGSKIKKQKHKENKNAHERAHLILKRGQDYNQNTYSEMDIIPFFIYLVI